MILEYYNECYERTLMVRMPPLTDVEYGKALEVIDDAYNLWVGIEDIKDPDYQRYVEDSCLEAFEIECLNKEFPQWEEWWAVEDTDIVENKGDVIGYDA